MDAASPQASGLAGSPPVGCLAASLLLGSLAWQLGRLWEAPHGQGGSAIQPVALRGSCLQMKAACVGFIAVSRVDMQQGLWSQLQPDTAQLLTCPGSHCMLASVSCLIGVQLVWHGGCTQVSALGAAVWTPDDMPGGQSPAKEHNTCSMGAMLVSWLSRLRGGRASTGTFGLCGAADGSGALIAPL